MVVSVVGQEAGMVAASKDGVAGKTLAVLDNPKPVPGGAEQGAIVLVGALVLQANARSTGDAEMVRHGKSWEA